MTCSRSEFSPSMWVPVSFQGLNSGWQACTADTFPYSAISLAPCAYFLLFSIKSYLCMLDTRPMSDR